MNSELRADTSGPMTVPRWRKPLLWCGGAFVVLLLVLFAAGTLVARRLTAIVRSRLVATLEERFHSPVTLDALEAHYDGQIQVDARGLRIQSVLNGLPGDPQHPMLQVQEFHFHLGLLAALSRSPRIHHVRIRGVQLDLPPAAAQPGHGPEPDREVDLEYAEVDDAHIRFASSAADRAPLQFDLPHLVFRGVSRSKPIAFHAVVDNGPPLGITESDGTVGPWNFDDPRLTPIQGSFAFQNKDMSSVHGLRGRLSLNGHYSGTVAGMHAEGTTDDPTFALDVSSRPVDLRTRFAITLRAPESTVALERVEGSFGSTAFVCRGLALKDRERDSFRLDVQLEAPAARVEDVLTIATHTAPPVLRGALSLAGRLQMRAGSESVSRKLSLQDAKFTIRGGTFSSAAMQGTVNELTERAQGDPEDAKAGHAALVAATLQGSVHLHDAVLHFPEMHVTAPGAQAVLHGTYALGQAVFVFDGDVHTEAKLSHMTTGVKSKLLKPFNKLFGHGNDQAGATLPLHVEGAAGTLHVDTSVAGMRVKAPGTE